MLRPTNRRGPLLCLALAFALSPPACFANGWVSAVNAFRQTPEFYFIFASIVLVESIALWFWLRPIRALAVLWRVFLFNAVSSLAGDALFRLGIAPDYGDLWKQAIPFFLLTLALETPLMRFLFRKSFSNWKRTLLVAITANVASYALLMAIEEPVRYAWFRKLYEHDQRILNQWTSLPMLAEAPGRIYGLNGLDLYTGRPLRLGYFDFADRQWHAVSNAPTTFLYTWDIEGDLFAFVDDSDKATGQVLKLTRLPTCETIRVFSSPMNHRYGVSSKIAISPDCLKVAVLLSLHEIKGPLSGSSYQVLATIYQLVVFDTATGEMMTCPRKATDSLCWLPDSRTLLFQSLKDEKMLQLTTLPKGWKKSYHRGKPDDPFLNPPLFAWHLGSGSVRPFADIPSSVVSFSRVAVSSNRLVFVSEPDTLTLLDFTSNTRSRVVVGPISRYSDIALSPDGRFAVVPLVLSPHISYIGYPTIVDLDDPSRRYYLGQMLYRTVWAGSDAPQNRSAGGPRPQQPRPH